MSQQAIADLTEVRREQWLKYEAGAEPGASVLSRAMAAGVDVSYVLTGEHSSAQQADLVVRHSDGTVTVAEAKATLHLAQEGAPAWARRSQSEPAGAQTGGVQPPNRRSVTTSALLQPRGAGAVRPLLLSLPLGEQGGPSRDYELIPKHTRTAAAGAGGTSTIADELDLVGDMAFSFEWLRDNLGHTTGLLTTIKVRGDSMSTTLLDGDTIMIDEGTNMIDVDGIYVLDLYGRRLVKRVQHLFDGTLVLISDNPSYQRETIPRDKAREVRVIGRMVWPRV